MPAYKAYPNAKDTPSRLTRKQQRSKNFIFNRALAAKLRKERRLARKEVLENRVTEG